MTSTGCRNLPSSATCPYLILTRDPAAHPAAAAQRLTYGRDGAIAGQEAAARAVGTTVAVRDLFKCLPVRHKVRTVWMTSRAGGK